MAYKVSKLLPCSGCGEPTNRRQNRTRLPLCLECSVKVVADNAHQLRSHSGPYYAAYLAAMHRTYAVQGRGGRPPLNLPDEADSAT